MIYSHLQTALIHRGSDATSDNRKGHRIAPYFSQKEGFPWFPQHLRIYIAILMPKTIQAQNTFENGFSPNIRQLRCF